MRFIERLRQQKEAEALARNQREAELSRQSEAEEVVRQQRETREKEFHCQRREQAQIHFQESQVESLVTELAKIVQGRCRGYPTSGRLNHVWHNDAPDSSQGRLPSLAEDPDSVSFGIVWNESKKTSKTARAPIGTTHGGITLSAHSAITIMESWDEFEGKFIEVETQPDGNIIFHARRDITVPEPKWKSSQDILDSTLEQAYNSPRIQRYNDNFMTYFPDGGD